MPSDLTEDQLAAAPDLASIDNLVIEELSEDEDEAFATALDWEAGRSFERGPLLGALLTELAPLLAAPGLAWETAIHKRVKAVILYLAENG